MVSLRYPAPIHTIYIQMDYFRFSLIEVQLMCDVVLVSGVCLRDSDTHTEGLFHSLFHNGLLQNTE